MAKKVWTKHDDTMRIYARKFLDDLRAEHDKIYGKEIHHKEEIMECMSWLNSLKNEVMRVE